MDRSSASFKKDAELGAIGNLTKATALSVSRRGFLRLFASGLAALGLGTILKPLPAAADDNCNRCMGPCGNCSSATGTCCSPNGQYCYTCTCVCPNGCGPCGCFLATEDVCDSGAHACSCYQCAPTQCAGG